MADESWRLRAACRGMDPEIFYREKKLPGQIGPHTYDVARAICAACPVRPECLEYALDLPTSIGHFGFWAGTTDKERRRLRARRRAEERQAS